MISDAGVRGEVRLVLVGSAIALVFVGTATVREEGTPVLRTTDEGAMQVAWSGAPEQTRERVPLKSVPGVSCRLKEAVWPAVTEAESVPVSANAGAALAKMFRTCGELGASSVTERVSLRGPEKTGEKVMLAVQLALAAMVAVAHAPRELVKSMGLLPPAEMLEMCNGDVPVLEMVMEMGVLASP